MDTGLRAAQGNAAGDGAGEGRDSRMRRTRSGRIGPLVLAAVLLGACARPTLTGASCRDFGRDYDVFWRRIRDDYVYLPDKATDWGLVRRLYRPAADTASSRRVFLGLLERSMDELYDPHLGARSNTPSSFRLVPSGLDVWAEWRGQEAVITQLRPGFSAEEAGIRPGMVLVAIDDQPVADAARARLGGALTRVDSAARSWALLSALAGRHDTPRVLTLLDSAGVQRIVRLDLPGQQTVDAPRPVPAVEARLLPGDVAYVRLNDLIDTTTVSAFDAALERLRASRGLILDLRNTPAGGNTDVAEPIMGRFITAREGYQRVAPRRGRPYTREVSPRGPWSYTRPLTVLVGRWTGSMGEGMAIGLDGMKRATVIGSPMAGLAGAVEEVRLPCSGLVVGYPAARLLHLDGTPRERFVPPILVPPSPPGTDAALERAVEVLLRRSE